MRTIPIALGLCLFAACGASTEASQARHSAYNTDFDIVWNETIDALKVDYPLVKVLDKGSRRIVTCWRIVDLDTSARTAVSNESRRLYRAVVEISPDPPYRVAVSGRAARLSSPVVYPYPDGDLEAPGWTEGRTDRIVSQIHDRLAPYATVTPQSTPPPPNPAREENLPDTCVIRPPSGLYAYREMRSIVIGDPDARGADYVQ